MSALLWMLGVALAAEPAPAGGIEGLRAARAFTLEVPYDWTWGADAALIAQGVLIAAAVDPALARPRAVGGPVLYAGARPAEPLNSGWPAGCLVALLPGPVDLSRAPLYFGSDELPERVDAARGEAELAAAMAAGFGRLAAVSGAPLAARDISEVLHLAADWIEACAPDEAGRAAILRGTPAAPAGATPGP
jgi:hypothetical protein